MLASAEPSCITESSIDLLKQSRDCGLIFQSTWPVVAFQLRADGPVENVYGFDTLGRAGRSSACYKSWIQIQPSRSFEP